MGSVAGVAGAKLEQCDCCQRPAEKLLVYSGEEPDRLCDGCAAVFWTAEVLLTNEEAIDETEIVSTLAFAGRYGQCRGEFLKNFERKYKRFELVRFVDGVPMLRLKHTFAEVIRYPGSSLAKRIRIKILSKFAEPAMVAGLYKETLVQENLPVFQTSPGTISWDYEDAQLVVDIGPREEIEPALLVHFENYPNVYIHSFPYPSAVASLTKALIGLPKRPGTKGTEVYASGLGDHGRPRTKEARTLIPACVAWFIGECESGSKDTNRRVKDRRSRVARMLNRHLFSPLQKPKLTEDPYNLADPVWGDAKEVGPRLDQASAFLQKDEQETAVRRLL